MVFIRSFLRSLAILGVFLIFPASIHAATYYVSTTGSDTNSGTSTSSPFRTIQTAANRAVAGDMVQVMAGTYYQKFAPVNSGTSAAYITYMPYPGAGVILDGTGVALTSSGYLDGLVQIIGKSYIKIQGFTIRNSSVNGINIRPSDSGVWSSYIEISGNTILNTSRVGIKANRSRFLTVRNNTIRHVDYSSGIGIWNSEDITVDNNIIDTPHWYHECQGGYEEGLSISSVNRFVVSNNFLDYSETPPAGYCENAQRLGIDVKDSSQNGTVHHNNVKNFDAAGIYVDGWHAGANGTPTLNRVNIYQNFVSDSGGITVGCEQSDGIVEYINIYNNLLINNGYCAIQVRGAYGNGLRKNINIYNNTIYGARVSAGNGGAGIYVTTENLASNNSDKPVIIRNNISNFYFLSTGGGTVGQIRAGNSTMAGMVAADHNIVYGPQSCALDYLSCVELGSRISASPTSLFVNPSTFDLHLKSTSPAINAGTNISLFTSDYDGITRPQGAAYDIGAFEYTTGIVPTPTPTPTPAQTLAPTPTAPPANPGNILVNPSFESSSGIWYDPWWLGVSNGGTGTLNRDTSTAADGAISARVDVPSVTTNWYVQFFQDNLVINAGSSYAISFWAKSDKSKSVNWAVQRVVSPYTQYISPTISLTTSWQKYTLAFNPTVSDSNVKLAFMLADNTGSTWFDGLSFEVLSSTPAPTPAPKPGDANGDGYVDDLDFAIWANNYGITNATGPGQGDFNRDHRVDDLDYTIWANNYGR